VAVALHTDSLNESGALTDTVAATAGRTVHAYHVEGGGGHPELLEILAESHVLASSTTPTVPLSVNTVDELLPMTMTVHRQNAALPGDVAVSVSRIRRAGIEAENVLHELGAISIINSDSMGMGRIGEVARRTFQLAHLNHVATGTTAADRGHDNAAVLRYLAEITINPAIAHGLAAEVGSLTPGKRADIVLWQPGFFATKPEMVIKSGFVAWAVSGDGAASTRLGQPRRYRAFFGGLGRAATSLSCLFTAAATVESGWANEYAVAHQLVPVSGCRGLSRADMRDNTTVPGVVVPPDGSAVLVDGSPVRRAAAERVPLGQLHHLA
jgi:urease subunit alpha